MSGVSKTLESNVMTAGKYPTEGVDLDLRFKFDFGNPEVRNNPWPYYRALQATGPIMIQKEIPWAVVSRYDDVVKVVQDHQTYSSVRPGLPGTQIHDPFPGVPTMVYSDPPQHTRLHGILAPSLTQRRIEAAVPLIREIVDRILDQKIGARKQFDGVTDVAKQLPIKVLGGMRGMSDTEIDESFGLMFAGVGTGAAIDPSQSLGKEIAGFITRIAESRGGRTDGDDPISICVAARQRGELNDLEFLGMVTLAMIAGILTISEALAGALYQMLTRPALHEQIKANRSLIPLLLEESMRHDPPVHLAMRTTTRDTEIGGLQIPDRTPVIVLFGAGNRDPNKFPEPDKFDITRSNVRDHLAFGQGIHYCIGHWLGRIVTRVAVERLMDRYPRMRLADGFAPTWEGNNVLRSVAHLPILID